MVAVANKAVDKAATAVWNTFPNDMKDDFKFLRLETSSSEMDGLLKLKDDLDQSKADPDKPAKFRAEEMAHDPAITAAVSQAASSLLEIHQEIKPLFDSLRDYEAAVKEWQRTRAKRHSDVPMAMTLAYRAFMKSYENEQKARQKFWRIRQAYLGPELPHDELRRRQNNPSFCEAELKGFAQDPIDNLEFGKLVSEEEIPSIDSLDPSSAYSELVEMYIENEGRIGKEKRKAFAEQRTLMLIEILEETDILFINCNSCAQTGVDMFKAEIVVIDEGGQVKPSDVATVFTSMRSMKACMMLGDPNQLLPYCVAGQLCEFRENAQLSALGLLQHKNYPAVFLNEQYRSAPEIVQWVSRYIYGGRLRNHSSVKEDNQYRQIARKVASEHYGIRTTEQRPGCEIFMSNVVFGVSRVEENRTSLHNEANAAAIATYLDRLMRAGARPEDVGILTYYNGQRRYVLEKLKAVHSPESDMGWDIASQIELSSVDAFPGQECEFIALCFVIGRPDSAGASAHEEDEEEEEDDDDDNGNGTSTMRGVRMTKYLKSVHRLACALTRARSGMHIFGQLTVMVRPETRLSRQEAAVSEM